MDQFIFWMASFNKKRKDRWREIDKVIDASSRRGWLITQRKMLGKMEEDACFCSSKSAQHSSFGRDDGWRAFIATGEGWLESFLSRWIFVEREAWWFQSRDRIETWSQRMPRKTILRSFPTKIVKILDYGGYNLFKLYWINTNFWLN